jgi:uncharacterized protein (DUF1800 family)
LSTFANAAPVIKSLDPELINQGPFSLTISGTGFVSGTKATFGGVALATTFISSTQIKVSGSTSAPAGTQLPLTVTNPPPDGGSSTWIRKVWPPVYVEVFPKTVKLATGAPQTFNAYVHNTTSPAVIWKVNGTVGGNTAVGTIAASGPGPKPSSYSAVYTGPKVLPGNNLVRISAASALYPVSSEGFVEVVLENGKPEVSSISPATAPAGPLTLTVNGTGFVLGSKVNVSGVDWATTFVSPARLKATGTIRPLPGGLAAVKVSNPAPGAYSSNIRAISIGPDNPVVSYARAARFLEQASWGPSAASIARVQQIGMEAWLEEQRTIALSSWPSPTDEEEPLLRLRADFSVNALSGADQLRQRVAFALIQIFVVSGKKVGKAHQMAPYLRLIQANAFGNYRKLLREVTLSPTMGRYLDMVNNDKYNSYWKIPPNENYARELMQLFTIGTILLNPDGSPKLDSGGKTIPAYTEPVVADMARALTGWTFPTRPGTALTLPHNPPYYGGPMIPIETNHDTQAKTLVGGRQAGAGQTAAQDLEDVLDSVFEHPNTPPFVALRLIQHLVTSNPSPAYVQRVAAAFANNGSGVRGDLWAVIKSILLDPEARKGDNDPSLLTADGGHLREPVLFLIGLLRALGATAAADNVLHGFMNQMGQDLFFPPSVFNYYSPLYPLPGEPLLAPEFQTLTPSTAVARANVVNRIVFESFGALGPGVTADLSPFVYLAADPEILVEGVSRALLRGQMPPAMKNTILTAVEAARNNDERARHAFYLTGSASFYQVAR